MVSIPNILDEARQQLPGIISRGTDRLGETLVPDSSLSQSSYNFTSRVFPEDLASDYNGHYMVININVPVKVASGGQPRGNYYNIPGTGSTGRDISSFQSNVLPNEFSKVDTLRFGNAEPISGAGSQNEGIVLPRGTRRIAESIALHMPTPLVYGQVNQYEEISLTSIGGQIGKLGAILGTAAVSAAVNRSVNAGLTAAARTQRFLDAVGNVIGTASVLAGSPINPRIEVLFATTAQRQFVFELLMAPRNERESITMRKIIETIRFHAAPEVEPLLGGIPVFIPPAEFDITFYNKGVENTNIPRINTCVLERIDLDYAPTGVYSTFRNGHPVAVRLNMAFREVEILHKRRVVQGF